MNIIQDKMEKVLKKPITLKYYLLLTKPGIIMGNLLVAFGAFTFACQGALEMPLLIGMLEGLALIIASACVFNNIIDRNYDAKMMRTRNRPLAKGVLSIRNAIFFGVFLLLFGIFILTLTTPFITTLLALIGFFFYVIVYSLLKYQTSYGTLIGTIAGSIPPLVGYTAASRSLDLGAAFLFLIMSFWQMPHFFSIAFFRMNDYSKASIPIFPIIKGIRKTKIHMSLYTLAFTGASILPTLYGYTHTAFTCIMGSLGSIWFLLSLKGFLAKNNPRWGRSMFLFSLVVVTVLSVTLALCGSH